LRRADEFYKKNNVDILGGPQLTPEDDKYFAKTSGYAMASFFGTSFMSNRYKKGKLSLDASENDLTSAICFIKKDVFKELKGFNLDLFPGEDPEFFYRAKKAGYKIAYSPNIFIYHRRRPNVRGLWKQFFNYGLTRVKKEKSLGNKINLLYLMPSLFIVYLAAFVLGFLLGYNYGYQILIVYVILTLSSSIKQVIKYEDFKSIFLLPFIYPLIHISYGLGLINGLIRK